MEETITIPLKEYKELLEIKGKYEEHQCKTIEFIPVTVPYNPNPIYPTNPWQPTITWY